MPKITAVTYYRFDRDYLSDYRKNLAHLCDDFLIAEDVDGGLMYDESKYRQRLYRRAYETGARWAVALDPDERIEKRGAKALRKLISEAAAENAKRCFKFNFRELYTPKHYRSDGIWGKKERIAVFPLLPENVYSDARLHMPKHPLNADYEIVDTDINIYHLKHISPDLRKQRRDLYEKLDAAHKYQAIGYDYLTDETDIELTRIPWRKRYVPKHKDYYVDPGIYSI